MPEGGRSGGLFHDDGGTGTRRRGTGYATQIEDANCGGKGGGGARWGGRTDTAVGKKQKRKGRSYGTVPARLTSTTCAIATPNCNAHKTQ